MKKALLSLTLLAASGIAAHAQDSSTANDNHFGIKAGATMSNFIGSDVSSDTKYKFGFHAGFVANIGLGNTLSIQPELLYSMKGYKNESTVGSNTVTLNQTLQYIELPIVLKAKFNQFFVEAGPQGGFLIGAPYKLEGGSSSVEASNKSFYSEIDLGYVAGVGYQLESGPMLGLRYNGGITNTPQSVSVNGVASQLKARNTAFQVYVGYMFGSK